MQGQQIDTAYFNPDSTAIVNRFSEYLDCYCLQSFVNKEIKFKKSKVKVNFAFYNYINSTIFLGMSYAVFDSIGGAYIHNELSKYLSAFPNEQSSNYYSLCSKFNGDIKTPYLRKFYQYYSSR